MEETFAVPQPLFIPCIILLTEPIAFHFC